MVTHRYAVGLEWIGNDGHGTRSYRSYRRSHLLHADGKPSIPGSSDPVFRGDADRWNPEELLIGAISACHQLWYLHLCADRKIVVLSYEDAAEGVMEESPDGSGRFVSVVLRPRVILESGADVQAAIALHDTAGQYCCIAGSMNFPVSYAPEIRTQGPAA